MIGQQIQNYQIKAHLGEGGMGSVYLATDIFLDRLVALKILHNSLTSQAQLLERFKKEARVLARLVHPNIASIYNFIEQSGNYFMVMEYVEGRNLDAMLRQQGKLPYQLIVSVFIQVLEGLQYAHNKGVYHRDIKPSNIILDLHGTVKIMDFGIAVIAGEQRLTQVNKLVGTIEYLAPELIQGKDPSIASDLFSIGVAMYELLTGKLPFEGNTDFNIMQNIIKQTPLTIDKIDVAIPKALAKIISKTLEKNPQNRYANAKDLQQELLMTFPLLNSYDLSERYLNEPIPVTRIISNDNILLDNSRPTALQHPKPNAISQTVNTITSQLNNRLNSFPKKYIILGLTVLIVAIFSLSFLLGNKKEKEIAVVSSTKHEAKEEMPQRTVQIKGNQTASDNMTNHQEGQQGFYPIIDNKEQLGEVEKEPVQRPKRERSLKDTHQQRVAVLPVKEDTIAATPKVSESVKVRLSSKVTVDLYLLDPIDPATIYEGQALKFIATNNIIYNGVIIIKKGATATANIKTITKKKFSVHFHTIMGANGKNVTFMPPTSLLKEINAYRLDELPAKRNFGADLNKGVTFAF